MHLINQQMLTTVGQYANESDPILLSRCQGTIHDTVLESWTPDQNSLATTLSTPLIGSKDGPYFLRTHGTKRNNTDTSGTANVIILDGDSRIGETGEIISGAPAQRSVHIQLARLDLTHFVYASHSNGATREELDAKGIDDTGGVYDANYYKYRVVIPCTYNREQLPALLDYLFSELHKAGVMLADVKENHTWAQGWYFPRVPDQRRKDLFKFNQHIGSSLDVEAIFTNWLKTNPASIVNPAYVTKILDDVSRRDVRIISSDNGSSIYPFLESHDLVETIESFGYIRNGKDRWLCPDSTSGIAGVLVCRNCKDGKLRFYSTHGSDPLNDGKPKDAFDIHRILGCGGDMKTALNWNPSLTKQLQSNYRQQQAKTAAQPPPINAKTLTRPVLLAQQDAGIDYSTMPDYEAKPALKIPFSMSAFSLSGQSKVMELKMLEDRFVLDRIAILGQATTIYAKPNTGKTLLVFWMLIESIKSGRINGKDVFYINADDDYKGLVFKTSLAEKFGFEMLAPGHNGFESASLQGYMRQMIDDDTARGTIIVLDTLKKFTDLMSKKSGSEFMNRAREFVAHGGTLIMLAHTNKNRDADGKAVFGGTSDIVDDCDCVFMLDEVAKTTTIKQVLFENIKSRGIVANELAFSYSVEEGKHYQYRLDSVEPADKKATEQAKNDKIIADKKAKNKPAIDAITEAIEQGITLKTELITTAHNCSGISKRHLTAVLNEYLGTDLNSGDLWRESVGIKNAKSYHLLTTTQATAQDYSFFKNGGE